MLNQFRRLEWPFIRYIAITFLGMPIFVAFRQAFSSFSYFSEKCQFQQLMGFPAPSCGLTRAFIAFASGDLRLSFQYHFFGPLFFLLFLLLIVIFATEICAKRSLFDFYSFLFHYKSTATIVLVFGLYYGIRMYARYSTLPLPTPVENNIIWQFLKIGALKL